MAYGQNYDDAGDYGGVDPFIGMVWNPQTGQYEMPPASPQDINPITGLPYTGLRPVGENPATGQEWTVNDTPPEGLHYPTPPQTPPAYGSDTRSYDDTARGGGGTLFNLGQPGTLTAPFTGTFTAPTRNPLPTIPGLHLPAFKAPDPFRGTTAADVTADPGYGFLLKEGQTGVQQSAAARGLLNSGGTLKDIARWTEDYAGTKFNDVDQRRRGDYLLNYQTQTLDPYKFAYQGALDTYAPQLTGWTTEASNTQHNNDLDYSNAWERFLNSQDIFRDQRDSTWNKASQVLMA